MYKRLPYMFVVITLSILLCVNVFAAYADVIPEESTTDTVLPLEDNKLAAKSAEGSSTSDILEEAYQAIALNSSQEKSTPPEAVGSKLIVNSVPIDDAQTTVYKDTTYISIRTIVSALDPSASITWQNGQLLAKGKGFQLTAKPGDIYIVVNDRYLYVPDSVLFRNDNTMAPIRTICTALGATTEWEVMTKNINVTTTTTPLASGASYYNSNDLYWLSRIITAESRNQPLKGKIGVGTVIMNRVESPKFPNTIHDVIFSGNQFSPVQNGSIYNEPSQESVIAAKLVLDGAREAGDSLFFNRAGLNCWAARSKEHITTIADHSFYQ